MTECQELERKFIVVANQHYNSFGEVFQTKSFATKATQLASYLARLVRNKQLAENDAYREARRFAEEEYSRLYPLDD